MLFYQNMMTLCSTTSVRSGIGHIDVEYCNVAGFTHVGKLSLDNSINLCMK
jgi:hypothetical protein